MIKNSVISLAAFAVAILLSSHPAIAQQQLDPNKAVGIAVVDTEVILRESAAVKDIRRQLADHQKSLREQDQKAEEALKASEQNLRQQRTILAAEAFNEQRRKFEESVREAQRSSRSRALSLDKVRVESMRKVEVEFQKVVVTLSGERNLGMVFRRDQMVTAAPGLDITAEVLKRLNEALPTVQVPNPGQ